jgi:hypothetical protein
MSAQNVLHEIQYAPRHGSSWTAASIQRYLDYKTGFLWIGEEREASEHLLWRSVSYTMLIGMQVSE